MPEVLERRSHNREDATYFESLLAPILDPAFGMAFRLTRNRDEAEDLVQDASVQAFHAFHTFERGTNFKAWFFRIMINLFRKRAIKRSRGPEMTPLDDAPDLYLYIHSSRAGINAPNGNPAALVISKMTETMIQQAIEALPEEYQIVSVLYFMEEVSYQEIADMVGVPVGTVRSRLHRGRKLLQKALWQVAEEQNLVGELQA
jgi:RNA polymerase sigma-70 factor (ECF subfamily)